jgi:hypothetical protein
MKIYTKEEIKEKLKEIIEIGWVESTRHGNQGGIGNTLEDLLGIEENNLPLPNASEWELKSQRAGSSALVTLFHMEPSPRSLRFVPQILLPKYGWPHDKAGEKYPKNEMSFRQTINALSRSDRGFRVVVDRSKKKILVSFDPKSVAKNHSRWLSLVKKRVKDLGELNPQPYWGFDDLYHKAATKLLNTFFVEAQSKKKNGKEFFDYKRAEILQNFSQEKWIKAIEEGKIYIDFDARTGHNHGTKFRIRSGEIENLYEIVEVIARD